MTLTPAPFPSVHPPKALTIQDKRDIVEALFKAWVDAEQLRLGQLIVCAMGTQNLFHISNEDLAVEVARFAAQVTK